VSSFAQTSAVNRRRLRNGVVTEGGNAKAEQFRQYAQEAMRRAYQSETQKEKEALIELAYTWTRAAMQSESAVVISGSPPRS
jgi:hypothetical protein